MLLNRRYRKAYRQKNWKKANYYWNDTKKRYNVNLPPFLLDLIENKKKGLDYNDSRE